MPNFLRFAPKFQCVLMGALFLNICGGRAFSQEGVAPANQPDAPAPAPAEATPAEDAPKLGLTLGADLYYGASNLPGLRRFRDGFWLGSGTSFPSNVYGVYNSKDGTTAKLAVSVGKLYNGQFENFDQPVEAYVSKSYNGIQFTAGKFYVPFELMEWEYETEWGFQAAKDMGDKGSLTVAVTDNRNRGAANGYLRYARTMGVATVGVSLGGGRGFSFDTDHNQGAALDLTLEKGRFKLDSAAMTARKSGDDSRFGFAYARLNYKLGEKTNLYVARHSWTDRLGQQGDGHFSTLGSVYHINDSFSVEGAVSHSGDIDKNVKWIELHYNFEK